MWRRGEGLSGSGSGWTYCAAGDAALDEAASPTAYTRIGFEMFLTY